MEQRRNEGAGETRDPQENPPTSGIVWHDIGCSRSGVAQPWIEPSSPWCGVGRLTAQPPRALVLYFIFHKVRVSSEDFRCHPHVSVCHRSLTNTEARQPITPRLPSAHPSHLSPLASNMSGCRSVNQRPRDLACQSAACPTNRESFAACGSQSDTKARCQSLAPAIVPFRFCMCASILWLCDASHAALACAMRGCRRSGGRCGVSFVYRPRDRALCCPCAVQLGDLLCHPQQGRLHEARNSLNVIKLRKLNTMLAYTRQKAKSKYRNRIRSEGASQKQSSDTHKTPYDRVKRYRERKRKNQGVRARQRRNCHARQVRHRLSELARSVLVALRVKAVQDKRPVIDGKTARQSSALRVEATREFVRMSRSPLALPRSYASDVQNSFSQAAALCSSTHRILRNLIYTAKEHDGNTAHLARRSDEALGVRVSVARIAPSLLDLGRGVPTGVHCILKKGDDQTLPAGAEQLNASRVVAVAGGRRLWRREKRAPRRPEVGSAGNNGRPHHGLSLAPLDSQDPPPPPPMFHVSRENLQSCKISSYLCVHKLIFCWSDVTFSQHVHQLWDT
ncbi:hypothetical protein PR048_001331 [Dryococelus australis]|uniref:Uncharacterized protein n=1 Tax=Dryococelus australis TaxID=614101 RepID=A0ABQ9IIJ0_9NEOP|nr:hypothetical protein PR048_001331 [Dryococelus australis]